MIKDATHPLDTSNWIAQHPNVLNDGWKKVQSKKSSLNNISKERLEAMRAAMKKTQITVVIRVPQDTAADYSAAETHINTIRELSKQDSNIVVLDYKGNNHVNIHKAFSEEKYKEAFQPREKKLLNGTIQISVAHYILSEVENFNKALLIPFLKKHHTYIHFNQKEGLEHFSAIGVLFGPHPELSWRDDIVEKIERTMKADISEEECSKIDTNLQKPKIVISMIPQIISNPKHNNTKSIALEIRVPTAHEHIYQNILDRLDERASTLQEGEVDLILDDRLGTFFPYYAKRSRPELFDALMRKQNTDMNSTSAIPIFGLTPTALDFEIKNASGQKFAVREWINQHPSINKVEKTASSKDLGKYMLLVDREEKDDIENFLEDLFDQFPENFQDGQFTKPQRGGNAFQKRRVHSINNYLNRLEEKVQADLLMYDEDSISTTPPTRTKRMTISYAQATRRLSFSTGQPDTSATKTNNSNETTTTSMSTLTQTSLDEAILKIRAETEQSIKELRQELKIEVQSMEQTIANAVIAAMRSTPPLESMDTTDANSSQSSHTAATIQTLADKYESLHSAVLTLTEKVIELTERQDPPQSKRTRPLATPPKFRLPPTNEYSSPTKQSPPTKVPRAELSPTTTPPQGTPTDGARGGQ
jgi:hypothetical protein